MTQLQIDPELFKASVVDVCVERFKHDPESLADAFGVLWAICALSDHVAASRHEDEKKFAARIRDTCWQFRAVWVACNAAKHAKLRSSRDIRGSNDIGRADYSGWSWYFGGSAYYGEQICVSLTWQFDERTRTWTDGDGKFVPGSGPFLRDVPVMDLILPAIRALGFEPSVEFDLILRP